MLRGVSEPFHNAPKIFRPFSKAFNSHLSNLSNRRPPPNITFPLLKERNGIDRRKSSFISRLLLFFRSKKPTNNHGSPKTGTTKKISRKERERRRKGGGKGIGMLQGIPVNKSIAEPQVSQVFFPFPIHSEEEHSGTFIRLCYIRSRIWSRYSAIACFASLRHCPCTF